MKKVLLLLLVVISFNAKAQHHASKIKVGQDAPELAFANPQGDTIKLSDINEKRYVLLDFWASWCRPCRMANPRLVKMYRELKDEKFEGAKKGFTVVSVSMDQKKSSWVKAIAKDSLEWEYHMSDLKAWNSKPADIYGVSYIPQAFLIGPDGKIIAKYNNAEQAAIYMKKQIKEKKKFLGIL